MTPFLYGQDNGELLIIHAKGILYEETVSSITEELRNDFKVTSLVVNQNANSKLICEKIKQKSPLLVVLMDNIAINVYEQCQSDKAIKKIPSISLMAIDVKKAIKTLDNAVGISYEVPVITSVLNIQAIVDKKINRVGVIHRKFMKQFININKKYCLEENIYLKNVSLPNKGINFKKRIKKELKKLLADDNIEAIWVPNDNQLLEKEIIKDIWIPMLNRYDKPAIVGIKQFVKPELHFGTFAIIPDHISLGTQTVDLIFEIQKNDWKIKKNYVVPPISIYKIINYNKLINDFDQKDFNLSIVDTVLQKIGS